MNFDGDVTVHAPDLGPRAGRVKPGSYRAGFVNLFVHGDQMMARVVSYLFVSAAVLACLGLVADAQGG